MRIKLTLWMCFVVIRDHIELMTSQLSSQKTLVWVYVGSGAKLKNIGIGPKLLMRSKYNLVQVVSGRAST